MVAISYASTYGATIRNQSRINLQDAAMIFRLRRNRGSVLTAKLSCCGDTTQWTYPVRASYLALRTLLPLKVGTINSPFLIRWADAIALPTRDIQDL